MNDWTLFGWNLNQNAHAKFCYRILEQKELSTTPQALAELHYWWKTKYINQLQPDLDENTYEPEDELWVVQVASMFPGAYLTATAYLANEKKNQGHQND